MRNFLFKAGISRHGTTRTTATIPLLHGVELTDITGDPTKGLTFWASDGGQATQESFRIYSSFDAAPQRPVLNFMTVTGFQSLGVFSFGGHVLPDANNARSLGSTALRWSGVHSVLGNFSGQITSTLATGVSPFAVTSTTVNTNLNADMVDGQHASAFQPAGTYVTAVTGASPISSSGGTTPVISIADAAADGTTKGAAAFNATNFTASSGVINTIQNIATGSNPRFNTLGLGAASGQLIFRQGASFTTTLQDSVASSSKTITLPNITGTLASLAGTQSFTGTKTFTSGSGTAFQGGSLFFTDAGGVNLAINHGLAYFAIEDIQNSVLVYEYDGGGSTISIGESSVVANIYLRASAALNLTDGMNIVTGTTTGMKIGTAATQKLGFWGTTPVIRSAGWSATNVTADKVFNADATTVDELADVLGTLINDLKTYGILGA